MDVKTQLAELDKELGISELHDRDEQGKKDFVQTQIEEIQAVIWRLRVDILLNKNIEATTSDEQDALDAKVKEMTRDVTRMKQALDTLHKIKESL